MEHCMWPGMTCLRVSPILVYFAVGTLVLAAEKKTKKETIWLYSSVFSARSPYSLSYHQAPNYKTLALSSVVTSPGLAFSGRLRLVHADGHNDSVGGGGGQDLKGRASSALQDLQQDVRGWVPAAVLPHGASHLTSYGVASLVQWHLKMLVVVVLTLRVSVYQHRILA